MAVEDIRQRLAEIEEEKEKATTLKDMLKNALESDIPYQEAAAEQKDWSTKAKQAKEAAYAASNGDEIQEQISEINEKVKSLQELLSYELVQYYDEYKTNEFTDLEGNTRRFKIGGTMVRGNKDDDGTTPALPNAKSAEPAVVATETVTETVVVSDEE